MRQKALLSAKTFPGFNFPDFLRPTWERTLHTFEPRSGLLSLGLALFWNRWMDATLFLEIREKMKSGLLIIRYFTLFALSLIHPTPPCFISHFETGIAGLCYVPSFFHGGNACSLTSRSLASHFPSRIVVITFCKNFYKYHFPYYHTLVNVCVTRQ